MRNQILILFEHIPTCQVVARVRNDAEIFKRCAGTRSNAQCPTNRDPQIASSWQRCCLRGVFVEQTMQERVRPHVGSPCASIVIHTDDGADLMVVKTRCENVCRAVAPGVGDEDDWTEISLSNVVASVRRGDWIRGRVRRARGQGAFQ